MKIENLKVIIKMKEEHKEKKKTLRKKMVHKTYKMTHDESTEHVHAIFSFAIIGHSIVSVDWFTFACSEQKNPKENIQLHTFVNQCSPLIRPILLCR